MPHDHPHGVVKKEIRIKDGTYRADGKYNYKIKPTEFWPIKHKPNQLKNVTNNPTMDGFDSLEERDEWRENKLRITRQRKKDGLIWSAIHTFDDDYRFTPPPEDEKDNWVAIPGGMPEWKRIKHIPPKKLKSLLKEIKQDPIDKDLKDSTISIPTSRRNTELMYKLNANMRTGQEPYKYKVWDEKGKKWSMRDVEPEELEYYRNKNKIQEKQIINASFNDGGRVRQYQDGGDVNDLLKMLKEYKGAPEDKEVLSSLVSESTQPSGYTQPVLPVDNKIKLIDKPAQITQAPDEVKKADWSTMFANPMQMLKYTGKYGMTRPTKAELDAQKSNIYDSITSMFNPSAYVEALKHMNTSVDAADQALLQGFKDGRLSPKDLSNVVGNLSDAGMQALFLSMAPMASRTILSGVKGAFRQPTYAGSPSTTPLQQLAGTQKAKPAANASKVNSAIQLSDKSVPSLYETRRAGLFGSGLTSQKPAILSLQEKLVDAGLYNSIDEAKVAMDEIRNPSMNTILPTSGKTIGQIMKETQSSLLDYYTNPLAKARLTEIYGEARGSSKVIPSSLPGLSKYHSDPADLLKYKESYGLSGVEILDELYNKTGMLPRYYESIDKIKQTPSFGDISKGIDVGIYDEPFEKFLSRRFKEKASTNPDKAGAMLDLLNAEYIEKNAAQAAAGAAPDPITGVKKLGMATGGLNMIGALETFGLSQLAEMISKGTNIPISYAENYLSDVIYHELNHIHFGSDELPIEIIDGWTPYLTQDATNLMYKGGNQLEMTGKNVFGRPDPKGILQYKSQPVEIQARMGQTRRHLEVSLGYTKNEIENIALAAREESGNAILGKQGGMSFFGVDDGAGGKFIPSSLTRIENKLKELGVVNENRSLQKVLDDLTEAAQRTDDLWYNKVIGGRNEEKKAQSLMGLLWRVPVYIGAAGASTSMMQEDDMSKLPILGYKKGGLLNKLVKKYQDGGGIFKKLRQRRANRRIEKTPVRDASSQEVLEMLSSYGADSPMMQGEYDPREKEIVMYKDDADTLKHEQVHATQYGPLQRLAYRMNQDRSAPIQDPTKRKVYRKLSENISPEAYAAFNRAGKLILDKGEEFEAVLDTGVNAAKEKGVNFNVSFEEILSQLKNIPSPTNNMIGLMKFMENRFTREQRDLILKSIR